MRMNDDEVWAMLTDAHTGIFTTLRADGMPISLPVWFAVVNRRVYVVTRGRKVERVRRDPRAAFLVEAGERWADLRAVHLTGRASVVDPDAALTAAIEAEMERKYAAFRTARRAMPDETRRHYATARGATIELVPDERILQWDNRKLAIDA